MSVKTQEAVTAEKLHSAYEQNERKRNAERVSKRVATLRILTENQILLAQLKSKMRVEVAT